MNEKVRTLIRSAIPAIVKEVAGGYATSARIRFTAVGPRVQSFNNFIWIMVDRVDSGSERKLWAHTNDACLMVGIPPTLNISLPFDETNTEIMIESILAYMDTAVTQWGTSVDKVEILLQTDVEKGAQRVPNYFGDSDTGWNQLTAQSAADAI